MSDEVKQEIAALRAQVEYHSNRYYNLDDPEIEDFEYDKLLHRLMDQSHDAACSSHLLDCLRVLDCYRHSTAPSEPLRWPL